LSYAHWVAKCDVVLAARQNPVLHRRLALVDAIRAGRARERKLAMDLLPDELHA
jgi:hypothetical protein